LGEEIELCQPLGTSFLLKVTAILTFMVIKKVMQPSAHLKAFTMLMHLLNKFSI
jgi:hypothetical protein